MRVLALVVAALLVACSPTPAPTPPAPTPTATSLAPTATPSASATAATSASADASPTAFSFDVENRASIGVIVSVASDAAATMPGFEPGQRGTVSIRLLNPANGIGVEIQGTGCRLLASTMYPTPGGFTLVVEDGAGAGTVKLSTRPETAAQPIPLPSNSLVGCGG